MLQLKIWHAAGKICYGQTNFLKKKIKSWKNCKAMTTLRPLRGLRLQDKPLPWNSERQTHPGSFPGGSAGKEFAYSAGELGSIPGLRRSPGGRHGNPLQYFCLENPHGQKSLAGCSPWGRTESDVTEATRQQQHGRRKWGVRHLCPGGCGLQAEFKTPTSLAFSFP